MSERPDVNSARLIVTLLEGESSQKSVKRRFPPLNLAGTVKIMVDIVGPIVDEEDWECLK
ncbi:MAG: hypothetical protein ACFCU8_11115 [Thermosynechococcaceae cyanobacterium]